MMIKIIEKKVADLIPYENNARINDGAVDAVANSIKEFGIKNPIIIDRDNVIVCGHTRIKACEKLGIETVPCVVADDLTDEQIKAFRIADNSTAQIAEWDLEKLQAELENIDMDMVQFGLQEQIEEIEKSLDNGYGEEFTLPDGDKSEICQMTFTLHEQQAELIKEAIKEVKDNITETFGNQNSNGNALYEVVRQWAEQRK